MASVPRAAFDLQGEGGAEGLEDARGPRLLALLHVAHERVPLLVDVDHRPPAADARREVAGVEPLVEHEQPAEPGPPRNLCGER
jgi:hypothetical protein